MLYMIIEKSKDKEAVYKRFHEKGRMMLLILRLYRS